MTSTILVVENNLQFREATVGLLSQWGDFNVLPASDFEAARKAASEVSLDLVMLDIDSPDVRIELWQDFTRDYPELPVIALSDFEHVATKSLESGSVEFQKKPVRIQELVTRMLGLLDPVGKKNRRCYRIGDLAFNPLGQTIARPSGTLIRLTPSESGILRHLANADGRTVSFDQLDQKVLGNASNTSCNAVRTHISALRAKIEAEPGLPQYIVTVRNNGYKLVDCQPVPCESRD